MMSFLSRIDRLRDRWRETAQPAVDPPRAVPKPPPGQQAWRAAVVGVGGWGRAHAATLASLDMVDLVAIADREPAARAALPERLQPPRVHHFDDLADLLDTAGTLDLLTIATNAPSHTLLATMAVEAGVPRVVIEKPIGTHLREVDDLIGQARKHGARLSVNLARRWSADYRAIRAWVGRGELGPPVQMTATLGQGGFGMSGIHFLDLAAFLLGDPPARIAWGALVESRAAETHGAGFEDPAGWGMIVFAGGARAFVDLSPDLVKRDRFMVLRCSRGRIEIDELARRWTAVTASGRRLRFAFREPSTAGGWLRCHLIEALGDDPPRCDAVTGRAALEMVLAVHASSQRGTAVVLPLEGEDAAVEVPFP